MKLQLVAAVAAALTVVGCSRDMALTGPASRMTAGARRGDVDAPYYLTEDEFIAQFGPVSQATASTTIFANFVRGDWKATAGIHSRLNNDVTATLHAEVVNSETGKMLNDGEQTYAWSMYRPFSIDTTMNVVVSTMGHNCGLTGKARIQGYAKLRLITKLGLTELSSERLDKSAPSKSLERCQTDEDYTGGGGSSPNPAYACDDPMTTNLEPCSTPGGSMGNWTYSLAFVSEPIDYPTTGGGTITCEIWHWTVSIDGGETIDHEYDTIDCH